MRRAWLLLPLLLVSTSACGYRFVGGEAGLPGISAVAIETPTNDSFEPGLEFLVADALRRELLRRGGARLVEDRERADLVISGRVAALRAKTRSHSSVYLALEYGVTLELDLEVHRPGGEPLPVSRRLADTERYLASADVEAERKNRGEAVRRVASVLASRYFDRVSEVLSR